MIADILCLDSSVPTFETIIRFLGGLISAYDLSHDSLMLERATELGNWLLPALLTPWGFPIAWAKFGSTYGTASTSFAEIASLTLEFTRLSMLTGDNKYFVAVRILLLINVILL
jgi:mannosyl-oligosaccharide alpha-1,2-mannosidase